jgi:hypothetical protein
MLPHIGSRLHAAGCHVYFAIATLACYSGKIRHGEMNLFVERGPSNISCTPLLKIGVSTGFDLVCISWPQERVDAIDS